MSGPSVFGDWILTYVVPHDLPHSSNVGMETSSRYQWMRDV